MASAFVADLGGTKVSAAIITATGHILARKTEAVDVSFPRAPVDQLCRLAQELGARARGDSHAATGRHSARQARAASRRSPWVAAGVAVPGLVRRTGTVWAPNLPGWERIPLVKLLRQRLRVPVVVESDRNAAVTGEAWHGAARGKSDVIALIVGTGIGAGILSGGKLIRGAHELSGCAGWMVVSEEERDEILRSGCLEARAAGPGIARAAQWAARASGASALATFAQKTMTAEQVAEAARSGDAAARQIFERVGWLLGFATANLISLFDPEVIVLGGGLAGAADLYFDVLKRVALARCQPLAARRVSIRLSRLGNDANLLGMARLALLRRP